MKIRVEFLGFHFAMKEKGAELDISGTTLSDLIKEVTHKVKNFRDGMIDETGNIDSSIVILVNGEEVVSKDRLNDNMLKEGDTVTFMMMAGGG